MGLFGRVMDARTVSPTAVGRLAALDVAAILVLVLLGEIRHGIDVVAHPDRVLLTAAPFLLGWVVVAVLVGAYGDRAFDGRAGSVRLAVGAWLGGAGIGLTLRATPYLTGNSPLSFALVMGGLGALALAGVRWVAVPRLR